MTIDIFGVEEKSFKDKKDDRDVVYYRAYGVKPTNREKAVGGLFCEIKIDSNIYKSFAHELENGSFTAELDFDEHGKVTDWVVL